MEFLKRLSRDLYENRSMMYNDASGQDAMRNLMYEKLGVPTGTTGRELYTAFKKNKYDVYAIIDVAVDAVLPVILRNQFDSLANFHNIAIGDELSFQNKDNSLFRVALIAAGTKDQRRQNQLGGSYKVETDWYAAATYVEFEQFLSGQVDWNDYVNKVAESFANFIGERIYDTIASSYDGIRSSHRHIGAGTVDLEKLVDLARHVKTASGGKTVTVYGTVAGLSQVAPEVSMLSDGMKDTLNKTGYLGTIRGLNLVAFPDAYRAGTEEFIVDDNALLLIPSAEKIVDVVLEGDTLTSDGESGDNTGMQLDFNTRKRLGIGVRQASIYGMYKIN